MTISPLAGIGSTGLSPVTGVGGAGLSASPASAYEGPLDLVPGAVVAYSVRALSASLLGQNIFRLRRTSDDAEMDFAADATTGEAPVASITTFLGGNEGRIVTWYDQSGNNSHLTQSTKSVQPVYNSSGPNSKPTFICDGSDQNFMQSSGNVSCVNPAFTWFTIGKIRLPIFDIGQVIWCLGTTTANYAYVIDQTSSADLLLAASETNSGVEAIARTFNLVSAGNYRSLDGKFQFGSGNAKEDGVDLTEAADGDVAPIDTLTQPILIAKEINGAYSDGEWSELIIYNAFKSDPDRTLVRGNEETYFNL